MPEPTIPWRDGLAEFLPPAKKAQSIIRDVLEQHQMDNLGRCACGNDPDVSAWHQADQIMQSLTKEEP